MYTRAVMGTHFATQVPAYQYPAGTRVAVYWVFRGLNGYPGSIFITQVVPEAVHLGAKMADTLSFTAKVDMVDF